MDQMNVDVAKLADQVSAFVVTYSFQILGAVFILIIGWMLARWAARLTQNTCEKRGVDPMLSRFLGSAAKIIILCFVIIMSLSKFGISIAPMIAALGAVTLGASFAVQGLLANYSAGLVIILTRPFTLGDTVTLAGVHGLVQDITLGMCILSNEDGERITIPNKKILGEIMHNSFEYSLAEIDIGVSFEDDPKEAVEVVKKALETFEDVSKDPPMNVGIDRFADSAIIIGARCWVPTRKLHATRFALNMAAYQALEQGGFTIPFPQRDVRVLEGTAKAPAP